ncbi:MAG: hypothetical protein PHI55_07435 [Burkholderiaceae bacterium]|nr:hypothetical protein [Burkholderiaceae bacterium]
MSFVLHHRLQHLLQVTAGAWGLEVARCAAVHRAPSSGFAISY